MHKSIRRHTSSTLVRKLEEEPILEIGRPSSVAYRSFTRDSMINELRCGNFPAAARLTKLLKRLRVESTVQLNSIDPISLYRTKGVGDAQLFVAMCLLHHCGYNVDAWWEPRSKRAKRKHAQEV